MFWNNRDLVGPGAGQLSFYMKKIPVPYGNGDLLGMNLAILGTNGRTRVITDTD
jgi:hypothetical protein